MTHRSLPLLEPSAVTLPEHHARWLPELLGGRALSGEPAATCDDCAMVSDGPGHSFDARTKCCTFTPALANFLIGAALRGGGVGAASVRQRVVAGVGLSPLGLGAEATSDPLVFGRAPELVCPHYDAGSCSIWAAREATCATWFCKHARGAVGKAAWNRLEQLLRVVETAVARHAAIELGVPPLGLAHAMPLASGAHGAARHDLADDGDPRSVWGDWSDRREELFVACDALALTLSPADVERLGGSELALALRVAGAALDVASEAALPARVGVGRMDVLSLGKDSVRVQAYSFLDPLDLPRRLFDVLHHFDGRPVEAALAAASAAAGEPVPPGAIRALLDHGVLRAR